MAEPVELSAENFDQQVLENPLPVVVDFTAQWCTSCKELEPILSDLADQYGSKVQVSRLDVGEHNELGARLGVMQLPTVVIFQKGKEVFRYNGVASLQTLTSQLDQLLGA